MDSLKLAVLSITKSFSQHQLSLCGPVVVTLTNYAKGLAIT
jgi:hypothetical protein